MNRAWLSLLFDILSWFQYVLSFEIRIEKCISAKTNTVLRIVWTQAYLNFASFPIEAFYTKLFTSKWLTIRIYTFKIIHIRNCKIKVQRFNSNQRQSMQTFITILWVGSNCLQIHIECSWKQLNWSSLIRSSNVCFIVFMAAFSWKHHKWKVFDEAILAASSISTNSFTFATNFILLHQIATLFSYKIHFLVFNSNKILRWEQKWRCWIFRTLKSVLRSVTL